jgi:hypothetical protein
MMKNNAFLWSIKLIAVVILLQTLFFKFTAADESVYVFLALGIEPYGRIATGVVELIAAILILIPRTTLIGALLGAATMLGAVFLHLFILGIEVKNDGGELFILAIITLLCCTMLIFQNRRAIPSLLQFRF